MHLCFKDDIILKAYGCQLDPCHVLFRGACVVAVVVSCRLVMVKTDFDVMGVLWEEFLSCPETRRWCCQ